MNDSPKILEMRGISKSFPGVRALSNVTFTCGKGQVHALVGENGAGKSTLMKILAGVYQPDTGEIILRGQPTRLRNPREAQRNGISIIYQEFNLVPYMTVTENIMLGREPTTRFGTIDRKRLNSEAQVWLDLLNVPLNLRTPVEQLSVAQQQIVEILKALSYNAEVIVMDEPTAALTLTEVDNLFQYIRLLKERGHTIIFISHRLNEVFDIADWITVLKDGEVVTSQPEGAITKDKLVLSMVGRELRDTFPPRREASDAEPVLELRGISSPGRLRNVSLTVRRGEVVGIAGLEGHGQRELTRILFGLEPLSGGEIHVNGKKVDLSSPRKAMRAGLAFVSDDRKLEGLQLPLSIRSNIALPNLGKLQRFSVVQRGAERRITARAAQEVDVRAPSLSAEVGNLSGGNQQKTVLAKWLTRDPDIIVVGEPTRGIDIGAKVELYKLLRVLAERGKAVVMFSSDLLEVIGASDRVIVMHNGQVAAEMPSNQATEETIMRAATGFGKDTPEIGPAETSIGPLTANTGTATNS
jgi:ABC-type sugar transport system ATPase subunit